VPAGEPRTARVRELGALRSADLPGEGPPMTIKEIRAAGVALVQDGLERVAL